LQERGLPLAPYFQTAYKKHTYIFGNGPVFATAIVGDVANLGKKIFIAKGGNEYRALSRRT
jgi:hypothetical protein